MRIGRKHEKGSVNIGKDSTGDTVEYAEFRNQNVFLEEELEERAAIMEYDGGMSREDAERAAMERLQYKYRERQMELFKGE